MKYLIALIIIAGIGFFAFSKVLPLMKQPAVQDTSEEAGSTKISKDLAVENVKKLPEVKDYLKEVPKALVEVDNELEGDYNVHVYEIKDGHTATFNWYKVNTATGTAEKQF